MNELSVKDQIIRAGKKLYARSLVVAKSGNISARLDSDTILITAGGTSLGALTRGDIVKVDLTRGFVPGSRRPSSEFPLHAMIYKKTACSRILHCHPQLTNAYFAVFSSLKEIIFETRYTLGQVPVVSQQTVTVENPRPVAEALAKNPIVVLKNHGVVAVGDDFMEPFYLIEALESAVEVAAVARLFKKDILDGLDTCLKKRLKRA